MQPPYQQDPSQQYEYPPPVYPTYSSQPPPPPQPGPYYQPPPYPPMPPQQPPKKWYQTNAGIILLLILFYPVGLILMWLYAAWKPKAKLIVTGIFAISVVIGGIANATTPPKSATNTTLVTQTKATEVPRATEAPTPTPRPTATPKPTPTPRPTPTPDAFPSTNGRPAYNGPLSDFVGTYGKPDYIKDTGPYNFYTGNNRNTAISVEITSNKVVNRLSVTTLDSWTLSETKTFCEKFLPSDAVQYLNIENTTNALYNYHSASAKDIVLMLPGESSCLMYPK